MHLFAPERPKLAGDIPLLLLDGSAVPALLFRPEPDGTLTVYANVRVQEPGTQYYTQAALNSLPVEHASLLLARYIENPEKVLEESFGWKDAPRHVPGRKVSAASPASQDAEVQALINLL